MLDNDLDNIIQNLEFINSLNYWEVIKIGQDYVKYEGRSIVNSLLKIHYMDECWSKCFIGLWLDDIDTQKFERVNLDEEIERIKKIKEILNP